MSGLRHLAHHETGTVTTPGQSVHALARDRVWDRPFPPGSVPVSVRPQS